MQNYGNWSLSLLLKFHNISLFLWYYNFFPLILYDFILVIFLLYFGVIYSLSSYDFIQIFKKLNNKDKEGNQIKF